VQLINLQEILDSIDFVLRFTGLRIQDVYNRMLQNGWTLGSPQLVRVLQGAIRLYHGKTVRLLEKYWGDLKPVLVVSLVPHFNRALCQSLAKACPGKPFVTILTDIADYPPHFWIERQQQFLICGSDRAVEQARQLGHPNERIFQTSGMILNPRFYNYSKIDRAAERAKQGLDPSRMTGLVLFGGQGARKKMLEIDRCLSQSGLTVQLILLCGKNERLLRELRAQPRPMPRLIEGFTTNVPYYRQARPRQHR
jgi:1,2-diacylglycerol 3-beta-galactosyltransferase